MLWLNMGSFLGLVIAATVVIGSINCYLPVNYNPGEETKKPTPLVSWSAWPFDFSTRFFGFKIKVERGPFKFDLWRLVPPGLRLMYGHPTYSEWDPRGYRSFRKLIPTKDLVSNLYEFHRFGTFKRKVKMDDFSLKELLDTNRLYWKVLSVKSF